MKGKPRKIVIGNAMMTGILSKFRVTGSHWIRSRSSRRQLFKKTKFIEQSIHDVFYLNAWINVMIDRVCS